ncbi:hypothetical protein BV898_05159 [Hypsibius exemplaris]|uniref:Secreted protein n=1 Tax=Hypsibius exemplaris TaxID=2072580 RepID=A0A1W0X039_HYPEX|nr:hypothetical protein BV898_05159 [Hypsibius exemplaris]
MELRVRLVLLATLAGQCYTLIGTVGDQDGRQHSSTEAMDDVYQQQQQHFWKGGPLTNHLPAWVKHTASPIPHAPIADKPEQTILAQGTTIGEAQPSEPTKTVLCFLHPITCFIRSSTATRQKSHILLDDDA